MNVISMYPVIVFRNEYEGKSFYKLGLSKKDIEGNYINGTIDARFKKEVELHNKTKIKINNAWLDFYKKDNKTNVYVMITDFDVVDEPSTNLIQPDSTNPFQDFGSSIQIDDEDLPF